MFYNGSYNCVSASALYALAFQKLGIPFVIKEEPTHVYLVAFPDADRVKIETTSPVGGFQAMTSNFKQSYVKSLRDQKLISQQEASSRSTDELFDKYYFNNQQNVSLENLAGIQYMNEAVENMENRKFNEATIAMEKAYLLFPTPRTGYLLMTAYSQAFENRNEKDSLHAVYLGKLSRFKDAGVTRDVVRGEFARALNVLLFEQNKKDQAVHYHRIIAKTIRDEELKRNLEMVYHFETGRYAYSKTKFKEANVAFEKAMELSPDDLDVSNAFVGSLAQTMVTSGSSLDHISIMEEKLKKNPKLSENNIFNAMLASSYLLQSGIEFDQEKPVAGDKYRLLFEDYKKKYPDIQVNSDLI